MKIQNHKLGDTTASNFFAHDHPISKNIPFAETSHSVGIVRDAVIAWELQHDTLFESLALPVVAETCDAYLNDINGFHVKQQHVFEALDKATSGAIAEGNVGGGTGMICYEFKGGTGTASRKLSEKNRGYTVGVLVQANHGRRFQLQVTGVPVGRVLVENAPFTQGGDLYNERSSIIIVMATDAPLLPHQLKRLARRAALGLARTGSSSGNGSGDIFIAFSTANPETAAPLTGTTQVHMLSNQQIDPLFGAASLATEEAIINALVAAETMSGIDGHTIYSLPHDRLKEVMKKYNRLE
ncbi:MAG: P1 family peptidase [Limisphaerales bacterium]